MIRTVMLIRFAMAATILATIGAYIGMAEMITLNNPSFEGSSGWPKVTWGFDGPSNDVLGWNNGGTTYTDTGIDWVLGGLGPHSGPGTWSAYFKSGDSSAIQTTDYTIAAGDEFTLTFWSACTQSGGYLQAQLYYLDGSTRTSIASTQIFGTGSWQQYSLVAATPNAAVGYKLGVEFWGATTGGSAWPLLDDVSISVVNIPEPSSIVLVVCAAMGLMAYAWRKR